jgi:predicted transcriptional regulator
VLDRLHAKGVVARELEGRSFIYRVSRGAAAIERAQTRTLVARVLGGDPEPAIARLVDAVESIDPSLLDRLAAEVAARRRVRRGS